MRGSAAELGGETGEAIALVGGSGFIGTRLAGRFLRKGHRVVIADKAQSAAHPALWARCDVRDPESLVSALAGCEVVYNLAAEHGDDVKPLSLYDEVNVDGARNLCRALETLGIRRLVFTSSVTVYGFSPEELDESAECRTFNDYGRTKLEAERVYQDWARKSPDRSLVIVRPTVVFGEGNRGNVYRLLRQLASGRFVMVGDGRNRKSMSYVENVIAFLDFARSFDPGTHIYNYADKPDLDMNTLVEIVRRALGKSPRPALRVPRFVGYGFGIGCDIAARVLRRKLVMSAVRVRKFCENTQVDSRRALATGFRPPVSLEEALDRIMAAEFGAKTAPKDALAITDRAAR